MAFVKPYTYVDNTNLQADDQHTNEEALKRYVNQEIEKVDIENGKLDKTDISQPRYISAVDTHDFVTKTVSGINGKRDALNYSYFSSTTKMINQTANNVVDWQAITDGCIEVYSDRANTELLVTVYAQFAAFDNASGVPFSPGSGQWTCPIALSIRDVGGKIAGNASTINYVFEGTGTLPGGAKDPGDGSFTASRRPMTLQFRTTFATAGRKQISLIIDPRVEEGNCIVKSILAEVFYI